MRDYFAVSRTKVDKCFDDDICMNKYLSAYFILDVDKFQENEVIS